MLYSTNEKIDHKRKRPLSFYSQRLYDKFWRVQAEPAVIGDLARAYFIDLAHWEEVFKLSDAVPGLIDGAIQKVTQGTWYTDSKLQQHYDNGVSHVAVPGGYHYAESASRGVDQGDYFLSRCAGKNYKVLAGDFEGYGNTWTRNSVIEYHNFLKFITSERPDVRVVNYTNPNFYDTILYPYSIDVYGRDVFADWPLWIAQYPWVWNVDGQPYLPKHRSDWWGWQGSAAGDPAEHGTSDWVDRNVFNGTLPEFIAWANGAAVPPPDGGSSMETHEGTIKVNGLSVRSGPSTSHPFDWPPLGSLKLGDRVYGVLDPVSNWMHFGRIVRANGTVETHDGWSSAARWDSDAPYMSIKVLETDPVPPPPPPDPDPDPVPPPVGGGFPAEMNMTIDYPGTEGQVIYKGVIKKQ